MLYNALTLFTACLCVGFVVEFLHEFLIQHPYITVVFILASTTVISIITSDLDLTGKLK